jgi:hypothetical protein
MSDERVCIIFDTDFGERLQTLDFRHPIWVVGSIKNDPAIRRLWLAKVGNITRFDAQDFDSLLPTIDEHHPRWRELEVQGLTREQVHATLAPFRGSYFTEGPNVFAFKKAPPDD